MSDMRERTFMLLVLLVSVSAIYEWSATSYPLNKGLGITNIESYSSSRVNNILNNLSILAGNSADTTQRSNPTIFVDAIIAIGLDLFGLLVNVFLGWIALLDSIFAAVGLGSAFTLMFALPIAIIEAIGLAYFLIDLKKAIPFIG